MVLATCFRQKPKGQPPFTNLNGCTDMSEEKVMGILMWIVFGLVVGVLAEFLTSEHSPQGSVFAILLAITGAIVGGFLRQLFGFYRPGECGGFFMAGIGCITFL